MNEEMEKTAAHDTNLPSVSRENNEVLSSAGQNIDSAEYMDEANLPKERGGNDERTFFCKEVSKHEECFVELPQCTSLSHEMEKCIVPHKIIESNDHRNVLLVQEQTDNVILLPQQSTDSHKKKGFNSSKQKLGKYFYYDSPLFEETGEWIPVSVPPLPEYEHEEWARGFHVNGGFIPDDDLDWNICNEEDRELTMWDVLAEMLYVARGKVTALTTGDIGRISWISTHLMEQAWKEMAETLTEANTNYTIEIIEADPPKWLPDSAASACMLCGVRFHPIMCTRHHCRFCGGIFCGECSRGRSLLPTKFSTCDPERVCDVCCVRLECVQPYLMNRVSRAAQLPTHDVTDLSTLRSWLNFPWGQSMEDEIYKATNTLHGYIEKVLSMKTEKAIPNAILRQAKGLAIITVMKVGMMVTYNIGTGIVIACKEDGSWSAPSAISSFGVGWGAQAGAELIDLIIVLITNDAVKTFSGEVQLSVGASLNAAVGIVGRTAEAGLLMGTSGRCSAFYTYSCSKGAFIGCSLEGSIVTTRNQENARFYGSHSLAASEILFGALPRPPAAAILYRAIGDLYQKLER